MGIFPQAPRLLFEGTKSSFGYDNCSSSSSGNQKRAAAKETSATWQRTSLSSLRSNEAGAVGTIQGALDADGAKSEHHKNGQKIRDHREL